MLCHFKPLFLHDLPVTVREGDARNTQSTRLSAWTGSHPLRFRTNMSEARALILRRFWLDLFRLVSGARVLALVDQAVVSATSFLTTVIVGRCTYPSQLGIYAIAISVLSSLFTIQGSLISHPYSIQRHRPLGTPSQHAGSSLLNSTLLSAAVVLMLAAAALALHALGFHS